jgi:GPH family glycoside/pentoside/hexuronide:cation symporter
MAVVALSDPKETRLPIGLCLAYGAGSVGISILLNVVSTFFPALMATVLGQSTALAGFLLTGSKLYDVGADIAIGAASDRTRSRWGRRRPYLAVGAVIATLSIVMIFAPPPLAETPLVLYMALGLVLYSTGYALFSIPYIAMAGEMTDGYNERTRLFSFRVFFISAGQMLSVAGTSALIARLHGGSEGYAVMGATMAVLIAVTMLISVFGTAGARQTQASVIKLPLRARIGLLFSNRPLVLLMSAKLAQYISISVITSTKLLFMLNVLQLGYVGQVNLGIAQNLTSALSLPFWLKLANRIGKKEAYMLAIVLLAAVYFSWLFTGAGLSELQVWVRGAITGVASGGLVLLSVSMLPDVMEYDRHLSGMRREGIFSSFYSIVEKIGYAIGPAMIGWLLAVSGYIPTLQGKLVTQPESAVRALYFGTSILPTILLAISFACIAGYKLDTAVLARQRAEH